MFPVVQSSETIRPENIFTVCPKWSIQRGGRPISSTPSPSSRVLWINAEGGSVIWGALNKGWLVVWRGRWLGTIWWRWFVEAQRWPQSVRCHWPSSPAIQSHCCHCPPLSCMGCCFCPCPPPRSTGPQSFLTLPSLCPSVLAPLWSVSTSCACSETRLWPGRRKRELMHVVQTVVSSQG